MTTIRSTDISCLLFYELYISRSDCWVVIFCFLSSRDLKESDADGFVQRAISAANVYNNIVKYIDDANITSLTTLNKSERAEDVSLTSFQAIVVLTKNNQLHVFCFRLLLRSIPSSGNWSHRVIMSSNSLFHYTQNKMV